MKGYKATTANMKCRDFQFKLNKEFVHKGKIEPCASGFHFCPDLRDVFYYYDAPDIRIFEIEATGDVITDDIKCVTNKIKFIREIPIEEIYESHSDMWVIRRIAAHRQYKLDVLINDPDGAVRCEVAKQGYRLDILITDPDWWVRLEVAKQGYRLDILINDPDRDVRLAAKQYNSIVAKLARAFHNIFNK